MTRNRIANPSQESRGQRGILSSYDQCLEELPSFSDRRNRTCASFERQQVVFIALQCNDIFRRSFHWVRKSSGRDAVNPSFFFLSSRATTNSSVLPDRAVILHYEKEKAWVCV